MMKISAIVAVGNDNVIGLDGQLPWYLPADLKFFKKTTLNHHVLMGRKCYQSIGKPLPKRTNIILTRNPFFIVSNSFSANSIEEGLAIASDNGEEEAFILGGAEIYKQSEPLWDYLYLTKIDVDVEGDTYLHDINYDDFELVEQQDFKKDSKNKYDYSFLKYKRK